eukprot:CAMPEP_0114245208 /NCGR_PEP_ID=MMETSP0058-20121206/11762_1 /TAXON_ID=36894 /ORGANISM="Pyramimonas parkeae, CCMP726" /LENGTH=532 /DNA_ID=CAMNT_0001358223 /DNA_START=344 /DNA_END=1942 /DNA_ORIENTATION=+
MANLESGSVKKPAKAYMKKFSGFSTLKTAFPKFTRLVGAQAGQSTNDGAMSQAELAVLDQLRTIIDPDFGMDIVSCGFIKNLEADTEAGTVTFSMELTTPACPIKDQFEQEAREKVGSLPWVKEVKLTMTAQPVKPIGASDMPGGLSRVRHVIAVSSCKGGVGKSTVSVNLAYSLAMMGAKVGIFDADVYGPSLPTMISPEVDVLMMDADTKMITPVEFEGVKAVSFGYAGQGSAIMRGPMVSGVIQQMLTTADWGELDYLILDFPPGTGDIQLTLCQTVPISAAVIVTTPQKLAFIDVAKGIRMFSKLRVPCVAVTENMSYFEVDGTKHYPFGKGSGEKVQQEFGVPHLIQMPITPDMAAAGDGGRPLVISDPLCDTATRYQELGACVVREVAKLKLALANAVVYDETRKVLVVRPPEAEEGVLYLHPATVRRNDQSASSIDEWTGEQRLRAEDVAEDIEPLSIQTVGNYAVQISWPDGLNQVATFDLLTSLERVIPPSGGDWAELDSKPQAIGEESNAMKILKMAQSSEE